MVADPGDATDRCTSCFLLFCDAVVVAQSSIDRKQTSTEQNLTRRSARHRCLPSSRTPTAMETVPVARPSAADRGWRRRRLTEISWTRGPVHPAVSRELVVNSCDRVQVALSPGVIAARAVCSGTTGTCRLARGVTRGGPREPVADR